MSPYIDAIVIPVPRAKLDVYKRMSEEWGKAHLRHGALYYSDSIADDVQPGKVTSFPQAVQLRTTKSLRWPGSCSATRRIATASTRRSWRIRSSRSRWTRRRCRSTASGCSGAGSRRSWGCRPAVERRLHRADGRRRPVGRRRRRRCARHRNAVGARAGW